MKRKIHIALICAAGGHFEQLKNLSEFYGKYSHFWVTNTSKQTATALQKERKYFINLGHYRKPWTYFYQIPTLLETFVKERPTHIVSTGSGMIALMPFIIAKVLGVKFIYIDTFSRVYNRSMFGSFLLKVGHTVLCQWNTDQNRNTLYIGPVFRGAGDFTKDGASDYVFVTLGTRPESFSRLLIAVDDLVKSGKVKERVIVQAGYTKYDSSGLQIYDFFTPGEMEELIRNAKYVITQESAGVGTQCLKYRTQFLVMPRNYRYGELPAKSDMREDLHLKLEEMGYTKVVHNAKELEEAISEIDQLMTEFKFDNTLAVRKLDQMMEET